MLASMIGCPYELPHLKRNDVVSKAKSWLGRIVSLSTVATVTDKPIVFVAYSLGGIVVKMVSFAP